MKRICLALVMMIVASNTMAESNSLSLQLPGGTSTYGQDSIRAGDLDCKNAIGGATQLEFGVTGIANNYAGPFGEPNPNIESVKDVGVYARIVIPLDGPEERINCNSLYELELRKKRIEVLKLQEELEALKRLNQSNSFEN